MHHHDRLEAVTAFRAPSQSLHCTRAHPLSTVIAAVRIVVGVPCTPAPAAGRARVHVSRRTSMGQPTAAASRDMHTVCYKHSGHMHAHTRTRTRTRTPPRRRPDDARGVQPGDVRRPAARQHPVRRPTAHEHGPRGGRRLPVPRRVVAEGLRKRGAEGNSSATHGHRDHCSRFQIAHVLFGPNLARFGRAAVTCRVFEGSSRRRLS
jgi:hypothetical protein